MLHPVLNQLLHAHQLNAEQAPDAQQWTNFLQALHQTFSTNVTDTAESYRQLLETAQKRNQALTLLSQVSATVAREFDLPTIIKTVVETVAQNFGFTLVSLYLLEGDTLVLQHQVGYDHVITHIPISKGVSGRVIRTRQPAWIEDVRADPDFWEVIENTISIICVPLFDREQVAGVFMIESINNLHLTADDFELMIAMSKHISVAIERAHLYMLSLELGVERKTVNVLTQFLNNISHDLRTPLSVMSVNLYLLRKALGEGVPAIRYVNMLDNHMAHLSGVVEDLLDMSQLDENAAEFVFESGDVNRLLRQMIPNYETTMRARHQHFEFIPAPTLPPVSFDSMVLTKAIKNILLNASQYTPEGGHISLKTDSHADMVTIEIIDTGIGINPSDLPHIFERFYRADKARPTNTGGAGLGLTIAQKIVAAHHGHIRVTTVVDEGSVFTIHLPIAPVA